MKKSFAKYIIIVGILFTCYAHSFSQSTLSVEDAISNALQNNYNIRISRNSAEIAKSNNTLGNAGMTPKAAVSGSGSYELKDSYQKLAGGAENNYPSLTTATIRAGAELSWTLYDGGKMFIEKNRLNEIEALGEIQLRNNILQTVYDVVASYYNIVKQKQLLLSTQEIVQFNRDRVTIAQTGFNSGLFSKTDLLQAKIDLNVILENAIGQELALNEAKKNLSVLLGKSNNDDLFDVIDSIPLTYIPNKERLMQQLDSANTVIKWYQSELSVANLNYKENTRTYLPAITMYGGYYFSRINNSEGSTLLNTYNGPAVGTSIILPLYSGGETKRKVAESKILMQSAEYRLSNVKLQLQADLQNALSQFSNQQQLVNIEKENKELAKENMNICLTRFQMGRSASLEVHMAQESYLQSCTRLVNFEYQLKITETKLRQLVAGL